MEACTHRVWQRGNTVPQKWRAVTGGLCDAAAQRGPLGLCMQLCGGARQSWLSRRALDKLHMWSARW